MFFGNHSLQARCSQVGGVRVKKIVTCASRVSLSLGGDGAGGRGTGRGGTERKHRNGWGARVSSSSRGPR